MLDIGPVYTVPCTGSTAYRVPYNLHLNTALYSVQSVCIVYSGVTYISQVWLYRTVQSLTANISQTQLYVKVQSVLQILCTRVCTTELYRQGLGEPLSKAGWELSQREQGVESVA
jgi:branched-subunit amino acid permease